MREDTRLVAFIGGIGVCIGMLGLLVLLGPRVIPSQFDKCWEELERNKPNCSITTNKEGHQFLRDSRCIKGTQMGMVLVWSGDNIWRISQLTGNAEDEPK